MLPYVTKHNHTKVIYVWPVWQNQSYSLSKFDQFLYVSKHYNIKINFLASYVKIPYGFHKVYRIALAYTKLEIYKSKWMHVFLDYKTDFVRAGHIYRYWCSKIYVVIVQMSHFGLTRAVPCSAHYFYAYKHPLKRLWLNCYLKLPGLSRSSSNLEDLETVLHIVHAVWSCFSKSYESATVFLLSAYNYYFFVIHTSVKFASMIYGP